MALTGPIGIRYFVRRSLRTLVDSLLTFRSISGCFPRHLRSSVERPPHHLVPLQQRPIAHQASCPLCFDHRFRWNRTFPLFSLLLRSSADSNRFIGRYHGFHHLPTSRFPAIRSRSRSFFRRSGSSLLLLSALHRADKLLQVISLVILVVSNEVFKRQNAKADRGEIILGGLEGFRYTL